LANSEFNTSKIQWLLHVPLGWTRWNSTLWPQSEFVSCMGPRTRTKYFPIQH